MERELAETIYCSISSLNRTEWVELLRSNPNIPVHFMENLLQGYNHTHPAVLSEVLLGLKHGLSTDEVSIYASPDYSEEQMREIRLGIENIKDSELVKIYAHSSYSAIKMKVARDLLESGFEPEKVKIYVSTYEYSYPRLTEIELGIRHGLTTKQIAYYAKYEYTDDQMKVLRESFEGGLDFKEVHIFAKAKFESEQMSVIKKAILKDKLPLDFLQLASRVCFNINQMEEIIDGIKLGLTKDQIMLYCDSSYSAHHMRLIKEVIKSFPNDSELLESVMSHDISHIKIFMLENAIKDCYNANVLKFLSSHISIEDSKMQILFNAIEDGINLDDITAITEYSEKILPTIINGLKCGITVDEIKAAKETGLIVEDFIEAEIAKKLRTLLFSY